MGPSPRTVAAVAVWLVLSTAAGVVAGGEDKKRRDPPNPAALVVGTTRYEVPLLGAPLGYDQDGGILVARHASTLELLWTRRIYRIERDVTMEGGKQDVYITRLGETPDRRRLVIVNERGNSFTLDLDGGRLRALP